MEAIAAKAASVFFSVGLDKVGKWVEKRFNKTKKQVSVEELKKTTKVLFVDDEDFSARLTIMRDAGWNVSQIKDITNFDSEDIKSADVIFMDYMGVGKVLTPTEQGIGLLKKIKDKYPNKYIIFYSGYAGFIPGHEFHAIADAWVDKHSDPFIYIDHIEIAAKEVYGKR